MLSQTEAEVGKNYHFGGKLLDQVDAFKEVNGYKVIDIVNDKITLQPLSEVNTTTVDVDRDDFETYSKRYLNSFRGWYSGIYTVPTARISPTEILYARYSGNFLCSWMGQKSPFHGIFKNSGHKKNRPFPKAVFVFRSVLICVSFRQKNDNSNTDKHL